MLCAGSTSQLTCLRPGSHPHSSLLITNEPAPTSRFLQHLPTSTSTCLSSPALASGFQTLTSSFVPPLHPPSLGTLWPFSWQWAYSRARRLLSGQWEAEEEVEDEKRNRNDSEGGGEEKSYLTGLKENNGRRVLIIHATWALLQKRKGWVTMAESLLSFSASFLRFLPASLMLH